MYDELNVVGQVKCFDCSLKGYNFGDTVPCKENGLSENCLILSYELTDCEHHDHWSNAYIGVVKNGKYEKAYTFLELEKAPKEVFDGMDVVTSDGESLNITSFEDLFTYLKERKLWYMKSEILHTEFEFFGDNSKHKEYWDKVDALRNDFRKKWFKGEGC